MSEKKRTPAEQSADLAEMNASLLRERLHTWNEPVRLGLVLGTGWGDALKLVDERTVDFGQLPGFEGLADLPGHERKVVYGRHSGISVVALRGRVHVNESFTTPDALKMVRLQIEMLEALGVRDLVLTAAVGSLDERISVEDNQARAKANAPKLAAFLAGIISRISAEPTQP